MSKNFLIVVLGVAAWLLPLTIYSQNVQGQLLTSSTSNLGRKHVKFAPELGHGLTSVSSSTDSSGNFSASLAPGKWLIIVHGFRPIVITVPSPESNDTLNLSALTLKTLH